MESARFDEGPPEFLTGDNTSALLMLDYIITNSSIYIPSYFLDAFFYKIGRSMFSKAFKMRLIPQPSFTKIYVVLARVIFNYLHISQTINILEVPFRSN